MSLTADALIRQWFNELWNQAREDTIDRLMAPQAAIHGLPSPDGQPLAGREPFKALYRQFRSAFPNLTIQIGPVVSADGMAAAHCRAVGTHLGDGLGTPGTGKPVDFIGMVIIRVENGMIVEGWNCFDFLTCYQQIGLVPKLG